MLPQFTQQNLRASPVIFNLKCNQLAYLMQVVSNQLSLLDFSSMQKDYRCTPGMQLTQQWAVQQKMPRGSGSHTQTFSKFCALSASRWCYPPTSTHAQIFISNELNYILHLLDSILPLSAFQVDLAFLQLSKISNSSQ